MCVIGVCSLVFSFQTCLSIKGLVGNWLPINYQFFQQLISKPGCGEMQSLKFGIESSMEYEGTVHKRSTEHYSHAEVLFIDEVLFM
jgi:hypothetical protein